MRNLPFIFALVLSLLSFEAINAQIVASVTNANNLKRTSTKDAIRVDRTGITDLSEYLVRNVDIPIEALEYTNEIRINIQIALNTKGEIIDARLVSGNEQVGKAVIRSLSALKSVSPILINGVPTAKTIQLPLVFTN